MLSYCLKYRKNIANKNLKMVKTKNGGITRFHIVKFLLVKNQGLSKSKKLLN